jgi:repressor LexA
MEELTERQRQVLKYIRKTLEQRGFPPSVREIGRALAISSLRGVTGHLDALERKGFIKRNPTARGIQVLRTPEGIPLLDTPTIRLPLVGTIAAGTPILAERNVSDWVPVSKTLVRNNENAFLLRVRGDSMIEDHILDGDLVIVRPQPTAQNGEIVAAILENEATVKRYYLEADHVRLQPANAHYQPILVRRDFRIAGKVIGLLRALR